MNLSNLKYVVEVEKTGSITRAAQNFFMNQPFKPNPPGTGKGSGVPDF